MRLLLAVLLLLAAAPAHVQERPQRGSVSAT